MNKTILVWIGLGLLIGGCSLSPKYEQPKANLPQDFGVEYSNETISQTWWKDFGDEYLNGIVEENYSAHNIVKTFNAEQKAQNDFEKVNEIYGSYFKEKWRFCRWLLESCLYQKK